MPGTIVLLHVICTWRESNPVPTNIPLITSQKVPRYSTAISGSYYIRIFSPWDFQQAIAQILSLILILFLVLLHFFCLFKLLKNATRIFSHFDLHFSLIRRIFWVVLLQYKTKIQHAPGLALCWHSVER